jgi:hypothetical protein
MHCTALLEHAEYLSNPLIATAPPLDVTGAYVELWPCKCAVVDWYTTTLQTLIVAWGTRGWITGKNPEKINKKNLLPLRCVARDLNRDMLPKATLGLPARKKVEPDHISSYPSANPFLTFVARAEYCHLS